MSEMEKVYNPAEIEKRIYADWEQSGDFAPQGDGQPFALVIPPPNVTGALHMGHALDETLQDILTRWHRLLGDNTLWVPGTDHAGIATQNVVERKFAQEGKSRQELGREKFIEEVWRWKEEYGGRITSQLRLLGASCDWRHERFTMDEGCSRAVREVFVELYKKGLIFKGSRIINWCPRCHTALSDVEVEYEENAGKLWHLRYHLADDAKKYLVVATTRPETLFGDTAVAVHPADERYQDLIGKEVVLPLTDKKIPIIADEYVDREFGTGVVKITPAHDANDYEVGRRHKLPVVVIMDTSGILNENAPLRYKGLDRFAARELALTDLEEKGLLDSIQDYQNKISKCYRCHSVLEPSLSPQWFVDMPKLAEPALAAVRSGKIKFYPDRWRKVYFDWMTNVREWCISRQIWWGHRIPVWYCECGEQLCSKDPPQKCPKCGSDKLRQDEDVLDTWFSSALWPFSTLGFPDATDDLRKYYPTALLVTGYDIITFWVSRMIALGLEFQKDIPFHKVVIHGLIRDEQGRKMSKSTGNAVDPVELIKEYGADALRFTLASMVTAGGQDLKLAVSKVVAGRNFMNKIWNVARFVLLKLADNKFAAEKSLADEWILSRYQQAIQKTDTALHNFYFGDMALKLYDFVWSEFCDWYIEMSKLGLHKETFLTVFNGILRLLHPLTPFITEEIWAKLGNPGKIITASWPRVDKSLLNPAREKKMATVIEFIKAVRNIRAEMNVAPAKKADVVVLYSQAETAAALSEAKQYIQQLAGVEKIDLVDKLAAKPRNAAHAVIGGAEVFVPLDNLIDLQAEIARLGKEKDKYQAEIDRVKRKLTNKGFIEKAPQEVIDNEKAKEKTYIEKFKIVEGQLKALTAD
ncbi:valyl-tRNA synthetase [Candidatus Termititenax persephonae]|uniref:Valine--tRNA ligase n=2 Tax=Candidatus Termititenax persephonae TaxID=2218525 RepID=A0A388TII7_9BACT|nr:valyl-tRNA synthetase [Candidatus Termititenax persephonae]